MRELEIEYLCEANTDCMDSLNNECRHCGHTQASHLPHLFDPPAPSCYDEDALVNSHRLLILGPCILYGCDCSGFQG